MWRSPLSIIHGVRYADRGMKSSEARGTPHPPKTWPRQPLEPDLTERAVLEHRMERHFPRSLPTEGLRGQRVLFFRQGTRENSAGTGEARRGPRTAAPGPRSGLSLRVSVRVSDGRGQFVASRRLRAAGGSDHTPAPVRPEVPGSAAPVLERSLLLPRSRSLGAAGRSHLGQWLLRGLRGASRGRARPWAAVGRESTVSGPQRDFAGELLAAPGLTGCREPGFRLAHVSHRAEAVRLTPVYFLIPLEIRSKGGESGPSPPPSPVQPRDRALGIRRRPLLLLLGPPGPGLPHPAPANRLAPHLARPGSPPGPMGLHLPWSHSLQLYFEEWVPCPTDVPCVLRKP